MIPKIIHYCWLSDDEYPDSIKQCIDSWREFLPDYELRLWDRKRFDVNSLTWTKQAFEAKKYAFAADYIRLYALYHEGGIYLDSDVVVYKSFNDLLHLPYFIGEDMTHCFEPAIVGCEPGMPWIGQVLKRYDGRPFVKADGSYDMYGLPLVFRSQLADGYRFEKVRMPVAYDCQEGILKVFPSDYFNSRDYIGAVKTRDSYCSHNYLGSWMKSSVTTGKTAVKILPRWLVNSFYRVYYALHASSLSASQIPYTR